MAGAVAVTAVFFRPLIKKKDLKFDRRSIDGASGEQVMVAGPGVEQAKDFAEVRIGALLRQR